MFCKKIMANGIKMVVHIVVIYIEKPRRTRRQSPAEAMVRNGQYYMKYNAKLID